MWHAIRSGASEPVTGIGEVLLLIVSIAVGVPFGVFAVANPERVVVLHAFRGGASIAVGIAAIALFGLGPVIMLWTIARDAGWVPILFVRRSGDVVEVRTIWGFVDHTRVLAVPLGGRLGYRYGFAVPLTPIGRRPRTMHHWSLIGGDRTVRMKSLCRPGEPQLRDLDAALRAFGIGLGRRSAADDGGPPPDSASNGQR